MQLIGALIFYNDDWTLFQQAVNSLSGFDRIIAVDGRYEDWPGPGDTNSKKKYTDFLNKAGAEIIQQKTPWKSGEAEKREACFVGKPGDWYILIDADEEFKGSLRYLRIFLENQPKAVSFAGLRIYRPDTNLAPMDIWHRCIKHLPGLHYQRQQQIAGLPGFHDLRDEKDNRLAPPDGQVGMEGSPHKGIFCPIAHIVHWRDRRKQEDLALAGSYLNTRRWN